MTDLHRADLVVTGGDVITMDATRRIILDGAVAISGRRIVAVGTTAEILAAHPDAPRLDASGCVVTPGCVNTHQHVTGDPLARSFFSTSSPSSFGSMTSSTTTSYGFEVASHSPSSPFDATSTANPFSTRPSRTAALTGA